MKAFFYISPQRNENIISPGWFRPIVLDEFFFLQEHEFFARAILDLIAFSSQYPPCVIELPR